VAANVVSVRWEAPFARWCGSCGLESLGSKTPFAALVVGDE
jgi:hypothetical protein